MDRDRLVLLFRRWSEIEAAANQSPLYRVLGHAVAEDPDLLDLANEAREGQPPPNILFAAVHALLAQHPEHPLAAYYATLGGTRPAGPEAAALFREFCLARRAELLPIIRSRLTQTNEVRRSALLLPAFAPVFEETGKPLALIEIGPSAGLNLLFDRYQYRYGDLRVGDECSPVVLDCKPRGALPQLAIPGVVARTGIDLSPLLVTDAADTSWLRALLWPEHTDRRALLDAAIEVARELPPNLHRGDVFELLPPLVRAAPQEASVCLVATFVLNQFSPEMRARLRTVLLDLSRERELHMVQIGFPGFLEPGSQLAGEEQVWLVRLRDGSGEYRISSVANPHGRWIAPQPGSPWKPWVLSE